jgi:hypothetical protein
MVTLTLPLAALTLDEEALDEEVLDGEDATDGN